MAPKDMPTDVIDVAKSNKHVSNKDLIPDAGKVKLGTSISFVRRVKTTALDPSAHLDQALDIPPPRTLARQRLSSHFIDSLSIHQ